MGPYGALNPHAIWVIVILIMAISAAGHIAVRLLGTRFGFPAAGLASGFISSTATIAAMGVRAAKAENLIAPAVAGAVLSTIATVIQMALVLATTSMTTLVSLAAPLICAGVAAIAYGTIVTILALREETEASPQGGRAFSLRTAFVFALTLSVILVASAALQDRFGERGIVFAAAIAGFADTHSAAISVASLVASGKLAASDAILPILAGLSTNTISKLVLAASSGGLSFAARVIPGLILVALAAWAGALYGLLAG
ncbi:MgtC/SapB family protein [Tardiphaga sp. 839_C3_N1_4]|uniref:MgtC/SapB family protein n=1 Tax=Tardiphaga sp. 839_C3_N1_4 TaxID=3240761 RepID=UPI003F223BC0